MVTKCPRAMGPTQAEIAPTAISLELIYVPGSEACNFLYCSLPTPSKKKEKMSIYAL